MDITIEDTATKKKIVVRNILIKYAMTKTAMKIRATRGTPILVTLALGVSLLRQIFVFIPM